MRRTIKSATWRQRFSALRDSLFINEIVRGSLFANFRRLGQRGRGPMLGRNVRREIRFEARDSLISNPMQDGHPAIDSVEVSGAGAKSRRKEACGQTLSSDLPLYMITRWRTSDDQTKLSGSFPRHMHSRVCWTAFEIDSCPPRMPAGVRCRGNRSQAGHFLNQFVQDVDLVNPFHPSLLLFVNTWSRSLHRWPPSELWS